MSQEIITASQQETEALASHLGEQIRAPYLILLQGDLAAGKTTFVRGFSKGFGSRDDVSSPSYTLANVYNSPNGVINHLDLYRLHDQEDLYMIGLEEYINDQAVTLIEWPEIAGLEEIADLVIQIDVLDSDRRCFHFSDHVNLSNVNLGGDHG